MTADKLHDALTLLPSDLIAEADAVRRGKPKITPLRRYAAMAASLALILFCGAILSGRLLPSYNESAAMAAPESAETAQSQIVQAPAEAAPLYDEAFGVEETCPATGGSTPQNRAESTVKEPSATDQALCSLPTAPTGEEGIPKFGWDITERYSTPFDPNSSINIYSVPQNLVLTTAAELNDYIEAYRAIYDFTALESALPAYDEKWFQTNDLLITLVHATSIDSLWTVTEIRDVRGIDEKGWDWFIHICATEEPTPDVSQTNYHLLTPIEKGLIDPNSSILNVYDNPNADKETP